jgi:hypothetical protein
MFFLCPQQTFLVPSGPPTDPGRLHLHVILTAPYPNQIDVDCVALVSFCSVDPDLPYDDTCLVSPGSGIHPFIKHPSFIDYGKARIIEAEKIKKGIESRKLFLRDSVSDELFQRITNGLCVSPQTPPVVVAFYWAAKG